MLLEHGTTAIRLTPSSILAAAEEDLRRAERNAGRGERGDGEYEQYAFHRRHVRRAKNVQALLQLALAEINLGWASGKHWTRVIYSDPELLEQALNIEAGAYT